MRVVKLALASVAMLLMAACTPTTATVTDSTAALADSESAALAGVGREQLVKGCFLQVLKVTDRAVMVKAVTCPDVPSMVPLTRWPGGTEGWVAKSALDLN